MGLVLVYIQPVCVFWLECLIHLHFKVIIDIYAYCHFLNCLGLILQVFFLLLYFLTICTYNIYYKAGFVVLSSLKLLISPSILNEILARYCNLACRFFPFQYFKYILPFPSGLQSFNCQVYEVSLICCFSLPAFNILYVQSLLVWLICVLACFSLGLSFMGLYVSLGLDYFLFHVDETFNYNLFKKFLILFIFSSHGTPTIQMLVHLILSQRSLKLSSVLFILFTLFCTSEVILIFLLTDSFFSFRYSAIDSFQSSFNFSNCVICIFIL